MGQIPKLEAGADGLHVDRRMRGQPVPVVRSADEGICAGMAAGFGGEVKQGGLPSVCFGVAIAETEAATVIVPVGRAIDCLWAAAIDPKTSVVQRERTFLKQHDDLRWTGFAEIRCSAEGGPRAVVPIAMLGTVEPRADSRTRSAAVGAMIAGSGGSDPGLARASDRAYHRDAARR